MLHTIKTLKAILFDMDGVLVDTEHLHMKAFKIYLNENGIETNPEFLQSLIGHSIENNFVMLYQKYPKLANKPIKEMINYRNNIFLEILSSEVVYPLPGITEILDYCSQKGIKTGLASSSDTIQVDYVLDNLDKNIACHFSFRNVFNTIVAGDTVSKKKPAPDIYLKAVQNLNLPMENIIAIEDSQTGVKSAKAAGLFCLALVNPYNDVYKMTGPDKIIKSIYELLNILRSE